MEKQRHAGLPVELEAARLAVEWAELFAAGLELTARSLASGADVVTADHYRRALATAAASVVETVAASCGGPSDAHRRSA